MNEKSASNKSKRRNKIGALLNAFLQQQHQQQSSRTLDTVVTAVTYYPAKYTENGRRCILAMANGEISTVKLYCICKPGIESVAIEIFVGVDVHDACQCQWWCVFTAMSRIR